VRSGWKSIGTLAGATVHRFVAKPYTAEIVLEALRGLLHE